MMLLFKLSLNFGVQFDPFVSVIPFEISLTITRTGMRQYESPAMYTSFERNSGRSISHYTDFNMTVTTYSSYSGVTFSKLKGYFN